MTSTTPGERRSHARQALVDRHDGRSKLLVVKDLKVGYGPVQVLFDIDLEVAEGEILALLGTNGAGKSTLLRAISGVTEADFGAVILDGRDITHAPPNEIAALGVAQVPGGAGTFPSLTVAENLRAAGWLVRRDRKELASRIDEVLAIFPALADRMDEPAANLSGGQQQMLALGMALLSRPRLLLIDELSMGLAPVIVGQLAEMVRRVARRGHHGGAGRAVGQRGADDGEHRGVHGARPGPLLGPGPGAAGPPRPAAGGVPRR